LKNGAGETPQQLAEKYGAQHQSKKDELLTMFAESETNDIITPAVVLDKQREESAHDGPKTFLRTEALPHPNIPSLTSFQAIQPHIGWHQG
jgi:hypothetical protein